MARQIAYEITETTIRGMEERRMGGRRPTQSRIDPAGDQDVHIEDSANRDII